MLLVQNSYAQAGLRKVLELYAVDGAVYLLQGDHKDFQFKVQSLPWKRFHRAPALLRVQLAL